MPKLCQFKCFESDVSVIVEVLGVDMGMEPAHHKLLLLHFSRPTVRAASAVQSTQLGVAPVSVLLAPAALSVLVTLQNWLRLQTWCLTCRSTAS